MHATAITLRHWGEHDCFEALTALLHRAYAQLAAMGLNYTAVDQSVEVTKQRVGNGQCFVAEREGRVVGTITVNGPYDPQRDPWVLATPWYSRQDIAHFHQLAVDPDVQGLGLGDRLVALCEQWARERGYRHIACDTAVPAHHLRRRYQRLGYREVDEVQWDGKVYRSVILLKDL